MCTVRNCLGCDFHFYNYFQYTKMINPFPVIIFSVSAIIIKIKTLFFYGLFYATLKQLICHAYLQKIKMGLVSQAWPITNNNLLHFFLEQKDSSESNSSSAVLSGTLTTIVLLVIVIVAGITWYIIKNKRFVCFILYLFIRHIIRIRFPKMVKTKKVTIFGVDH